MKSKIVTIFLIVFSVFFIGIGNLKADEEVIFGGKIENGGYGGLTISPGQINNEIGLFVGGKGAWILNHSFAIGIGGTGLVSNNRVKDYVQDVYYWGYDTLGYWNKITKADSSWYLSDCGYGGLILEYIYDSDNIIHFTGSLLIGGGSIAYNDEPITMKNHNNYMYDEYYEFDKKTSTYFVLEPALNVEFNMATWFRLDLGASYRIVSGLNMPKTTNAQMSGLSGNLIFKFGKF